MYKCKQLDNKEFATKAELFAALKANKADIIQLKKSANKFSDDFGTSTIKGGTANKGATTASTNGIISKTIIGNTYNYLDSHQDMHVNGLFTKSINENKSKILHLHDHIQQVAAKVGIPTNVYEKNVLWSDLGIAKGGTTTCLLMDSDIVEKMNPSIYYQYSNNQIDQHSVSMSYLNLCLCVDSQDEEYKEEYANWLKYSPLLGNYEKAANDGYFFAITEAKLKEISAVTAGSNSLTGMYGNETTTDEQDTKNQPLNDTGKIAPSQQFNVLEAIKKTTFI